MVFNIVFAALSVCAIIISILSYRQSGNVHKWEIAEAERRAEWEKQQAQRQLTAAQPSPVATGAAFVIQGNTAPQWLDAADQQRVVLNNPGSSAPIEVRGVLFPATTFYPETNRPISPLPLTYWDGKLDGPLPPGGQEALTGDGKTYPLVGDEEVIPGYTLCPQNMASFGAPGQHWYFARLTLTFRDAHNRTLASIFDWETDFVHNSWTQTPVKVAGPVEVEHDLRYLIDQATKQRQPPVYRPGVTDVSEP